MFRWTARRIFTDEFKAEMVALLESSDRPLAQRSRELGIGQSVLRAWRRKLRPSGGRMARAAANGHAATTPALTADHAEVRRLRRELGSSLNRLAEPSYRLSLALRIYGIM